MIERPPGEPATYAPPAPPATSEVPWGADGAVGALGVSILAQVAGGSAFYLVSARLYRSDRLAWEIAGYQFLVLGVVLSAAWLMQRHRVSPTTLGFRFPGWTALLGAVTVVVPLTLLGVGLIESLFHTLLPGYHLQGNARDLLQGAPKHISLAEQVLVFVWAAVEAPITEETLFRGIIFQGLRHQLARRVSISQATLVAALLSGLVFGVIHLQPHTLPILAFLGIVLAYVFQRARSLYPCILVHGTINGLSVLFLFHLQ